MIWFILSFRSKSCVAVWLQRYRQQLAFAFASYVPVWKVVVIYFLDTESFLWCTCLSVCTSCQKYDVICKSVDRICVFVFVSVFTKLWWRFFVAHDDVILCTFCPRIHAHHDVLLCELCVWSSSLIMNCLWRRIHSDVMFTPYVHVFVYNIGFVFEISTKRLRNWVGCAPCIWATTNHKPNSPFCNKRSTL